MAQVEDPINLDRWKDPNWRLITVILIRCGLRITSATTIAFDCVTTDADGAPYLRYHNQKMKREALVPIDEQLHQMIKTHQQQILVRWPGGVPVLSPRTKANIDGTRPVAAPAYRTALYRWLDECDIRDEHGRPMHLTPHQWRHSLGTRLINRDVPQEVVRRILDHDSPAMTAITPACTTPPSDATGKPPARSTHAARPSPSTRPGRWPRRPGPNSESAGPPRPCPTATAACQWSRLAHTPTPA
jgi:integrase